jgi:hypothetical protein
MSTNPDHDSDSYRGGPTPSPDCDPDLINDPGCEEEGIAAQAAYNAKSQAAREQAGADYATARTAYRTARSAATLEVQDLRHQVRQLIERIRCQIKQDEVVDCLDRAFRHICRQLDECGTAGGCCTGEDCDVDKTCPDDYDELLSRIAEYEARLQREKECFATLVAEPAALTARVAAAKAEVAAITTGLGGDQATVDLKKLYVGALVAQRHLDEVWSGFTRTQDYLDCLCRALTCWRKTSAAVSTLTGCKAVKDCQERARRKHCEDLAGKTVEEVLLEYDRLCGADSCDDDDGSSEGDEGGGEDGGPGQHDDADDCDCGHGHPHSYGHHRHAHRHDGAD